MGKLNLKNILLIFSLAMLIISLAFVYFFCWPKYLELKSLRNDIKIKQDELVWQKEYFKRLIQTKAELKGYETDLSKISAALPDDNSVPSFLYFLQTAAPQSGFILTGISPFGVAPSSISPVINETKIDVTLDGPYSALKNFLSVLERSSRFIDVEDISFSSPQKGDIFTFNLKMKFYSY